MVKIKRSEKNKNEEHKHLKESAFWQLIRKNLKNVHLQRIETGGTGRGIPDLNGCFSGTEFWAELKVVNSGKKIALRPEQIAWLLQRTKHGGRTFIIVRAPNSDIYLYKGEDAKEVLDEGLRKNPVLTLVKPYDWDSLLEAVKLF